MKDDCEDGSLGHGDEMDMVGDQTIGPHGNVAGRAVEYWGKRGYDE